MSNGEAEDPIPQFDARYPDIAAAQPATRPFPVAAANWHDPHFPIYDEA
jgi:hypothetical protein